jgi:hypothetical protein
LIAPLVVSRSSCLSESSMALPCCACIGRGARICCLKSGPWPAGCNLFVALALLLTRLNQQRTHGNVDTQQRSSMLSSGYTANRPQACGLGSASSAASREVLPCLLLHCLLLHRRQELALLPGKLGQVDACILSTKRRGSCCACVRGQGWSLYRHWCADQHAVLTRDAQQLDKVATGQLRQAAEKIGQRPAPRKAGNACHYGACSCPRQGSKKNGTYGAGQHRRVTRIAKPLTRRRPDKLCCCMCHRLVKEGSLTALRAQAVEETRQTCHHACGVTCRAACSVPASVRCTHGIHA